MARRLVPAGRRRTHGSGEAQCRHAGADFSGYRSRHAYNYRRTIFLNHAVCGTPSLLNLNKVRTAVLARESCAVAVVPIIQCVSADGGRPIFTAVMSKRTTRVRIL